MEDYNQLSENTTPKGSFLYGGPLLAPSSSMYGRSSNGSNVSNQQTQMAMNTLHLQSSECYQSKSQAHPILKTEAGSSQHVQKFHYPSIIRGHQMVLHQQEKQGNESSSEVEAIKSKIISHPQYPNLLDAFMDCQKVGAPPKVVAWLKAVRHEFEMRQRASVTCRDGWPCYMIFPTHSVLQPPTISKHLTDFPIFSLCKRGFCNLKTLF